MKKDLRNLYIYALLSMLLSVSCMKWENGKEGFVDASASGLYILCEGNFMYGNASVSFYDPETGSLENDLFFKANGMKLGDVAQSMTIRTDSQGRRRAWIVVNNSHVVFCVDPDTMREIGRISDLTSPRYIHFISDSKAYITNLWDNRIAIVDPSSFTITGYIECPQMTMETGSTEQMVQYGDYLFVNCWSYQNRILKIDTRTDAIVDTLEVGIQPGSMCLDCKSKLWVLTDGGYEGSVYGFEAPALYRINPETFSIEKTFRFFKGDSPSKLQLNGKGDTLYWINDDIWRMPVDTEYAPIRPFISSRGTIYYAITVDPRSEEIYVADAIDYTQAGIIYRYSHSAELIDSFYVGIIPGSFCWK